MKVLAGVACAVALSVWCASARAAEWTWFAGPEPVSHEDALARLAQADVVFVGEQHGHTAAHRLQLEVLRGLDSRGRRPVLAMEMFERDVQIVLDEYLSGLITESAFLHASRPWPNYRTDYRPMVEYCRERQLPVLATNAPRRYVNMVSRGGPDSLRALSRAARAWLPRLPIDPRLPAGYEAALDAVFGATHGAPSAPPRTPLVSNLKAAQSLWDATMADAVVRAARRYRGRAILHINGSMHSDNGWGIVDRVRRAAPALRVIVVSVKPDPAYPVLAAGKYDGVADLLALTPPHEPAGTGT
ncbi:MAG TPA: ChaN family lipoprotein [Chthonomonadales bacterium]|nr:ChaN family lipoprotein [Chthonomonadales bacterium]